MLFVHISLLLSLLILQTSVADPVGRRINFGVLQGTWTIQEHAHTSLFTSSPHRRRSSSTHRNSTHSAFSLPAAVSNASVAATDDTGGDQGDDDDGLGGAPSDLACIDTNDVTYEIKGNILRRRSAAPDIFNSNGKYYLLNAVQGEELGYVKFRVLQNLVREIRPCFGFVREGRNLLIQMSTSNYLECPAQRDEFAGVCNRYFYAVGKCKAGRCMNGDVNTGSAGDSGSDGGGSSNNNVGGTTSASTSDACLLATNWYYTISLGLFVICGRFVSHLLYD
ncbi:hypothetical protein SeMB42_g03665 [Synchytrium endobioticum]|uniref:Uncharacterized protein n=1 Tax=Synchytrium endobioticum TaxID=286115 RepID=A0A507D5F1_9FUNG|nr:hypothetical protein SeMB42_g03665 [Synchytrium endobioticum]